MPGKLIHLSALLVFVSECRFDLQPFLELFLVAEINHPWSQATCFLTLLAQMLGTVGWPRNLKAQQLPPRQNLNPRIAVISLCSSAEPLKLMSVKASGGSRLTWGDLQLVS